MRNLWNNPLYHLASGGRGPTNWRDVRGWLVGRHAGAIVCRLLPPTVIAACAGGARIQLPGLHGSLSALVAGILGVPVGMALMVALVSAASVARAWKLGQIDEWRVTPLGGPTIVYGLVWGAALPSAAGLTVGGIAGAAWAIWRSGGRIGLLLTPLEALLVLIEAWAMLYCAAQIGQWAGHRERRVWPACGLAFAVAVQLVPAMAVGIFLSVDLAQLGGHLVVIGGGWLIGNLFGASSERALR